MNEKCILCNGTIGEDAHGLGVCAGSRPDKVIPFRRCKCGASGKPLKLCFRGDVVAPFVACDGCLDKTKETIKSVRPVFLAMIKAGVSREHANKTMTYLLELHDP